MEPNNIRIPILKIRGIRRLRRLMSENFTFVCSTGIGKVHMNLPIFIQDIFVFQFSNKLHDPPEV